jgi:hypothetical protein
MKNKDTNRIKGLQSGTTGLLRKKLLQRACQYRHVLVDINEYLTSQVWYFFFSEKKLCFSFAFDRYAAAAKAAPWLLSLKQPVDTPTKLS